MKLEGDYLFAADVPEVWSALFDPVILAAVMPGCEKLELIDGQFVGDIKVKVGPIQGKFTGKVDLKDKIEPHSYTMIVDGRGAPGFVKATAMIKLTAEGEATRVFYDCDAQIGGKIASVGQRLIEASARAIVAQSLEGLHVNIKLRAAAYREALAAASPGPAEPRPATAPPPASDSAATLEPAIAQVAAVTAAPGDLAAALDVASPPAAAPSVAAAAPLAAPEPPDVAPVTPPVATPVARPAAPVVAFTPVKVKQSALANAVAKEVASSLFPRSVLVAIIVLQAALIAWLLLRH
jgi:uncharacterized protein